MWFAGGGLEPSAASGDGGLEVGERGEVPVDDGLVDQRPEVLGRLQLRTGGRQEDEADPLGDGQASGAGPCQPALSSTRTMWRSRPAPVCRAKAASSSAKKGFDRPLARYRTVSPLVGCTKAITCSH